jgi:hypothetical protein
LILGTSTGSVDGSTGCGARYGRRAAATVQGQGLAGLMLQALREAVSRAGIATSRQLGRPIRLASLVRRWPGTRQGFARMVYP